MSDSGKNNQARIRNLPGQPNPLIQRYDGILLPPDQESGDVQARNSVGQDGRALKIDLPSGGKHGPAALPAAERLPIALHELGVHTVLLPDDSP